ncbi:hypothetical protein An09g02690 [Aspergillus niger]|uniref:Uncharacterized protein n=2 Tax=Aspergillus niger TaxID=5061 RepID=A2QTN0_ASPNC|nr:hypothetical protein An09g02690 [Aspergillus niger]CAK40205.1 hypothetical protein An09g02690 [Aspergillus niger]
MAAQGVTLLSSEPVNNNLPRRPAKELRCEGANSEPHLIPDMSAHPQSPSKLPQAEDQGVISEPSRTGSCRVSHSKAHDILP